MPLGQIWGKLRRDHHFSNFTMISRCLHINIYVVLYVIPQSLCEVFNLFMLALLNCDEKVTDSNQVCLVTMGKSRKMAICFIQEKKLEKLFSGNIFNILQKYCISWYIQNHSFFFWIVDSCRARR